MISKELTGLEGEIWHDYYEARGFEKSEIRIPCHAKFKKKIGNTKSIVLVHGIIDSPFSQKDLAEIFFEQGYDVYLPLLSKHGLKQLDSLKEAKFSDWIDDVKEAIKLIEHKEVSILGFSLGGLISFLLCQKTNLIKGDTFLFSTPFEFSQKKSGLIGLAQELYIKTFNKMPNEFFSKKNLIDDMNPYIYEKIDLFAIREIIKLQNICRDILVENQRLKGKIYLFHSESDNRASFIKVKEIDNKFENVELYAIEKHFGVGHGAILFKEKVYRLDGISNEHIIEYDNIRFEEMEKTLKKFTSIN